MTNFATYIDSGNDKHLSISPARPAEAHGHAAGRSGPDRHSRRQHPAAVAHLPGDRPDVTQLPLMIERLTTRFAYLTGGPADPTLVYDAGQNLATNHEQVEAAEIGFVGSLPPSDHPDLLAIDRTDTAPSTPAGSPA